MVFLGKLFVHKSLFIFINSETYESGSTTKGEKEKMKDIESYRQSKEDGVSQFNTDIKTGLTSQEAAARL